MTTIYIFSFFKMFLVIMPVFVIFLQDLGLNMTQVLQTQAVFALTVALVEIPTGYFADRFGRKSSLMAGSLLYGASFSSLLFVRNFNDVILYEVAIGIAMGFVNGADVAILYDHLRQNNQATTSRAFANLQLSAVLGESTAALLAGFLASQGVRPVVVCQAVAGWIPFLCLLRLNTDPRRQTAPDPASKSTSFGDVLRFCGWMIRENRAGTRLLLSQVTAGLSSFIAVWLLQKYWQQINIPITWYGVLWASLNLTAGISGKFTMSLRETLGSRFVLGLILMLPIVSYIVLATQSGIAAVIFCFGFYVSRGFTQVLLRQMYNTHIPDKFRATANSLPSFLFRGSFAVIGPLVGIVVDNFGMNTALLTIAGTCVMLSPVLIPVIRDPRKFEVFPAPAR